MLESAICIGQEPPPGGNELIFLGQYRTTSAAPSYFPKACTRSTSTCRFEVIVRDNDGSLAPSPGDFFQISLSSATAVTSELDPATVFYTRAGLLSGGAHYGWADWFGALLWSSFGNLMGGLVLVTSVRLLRVPHRVQEERRNNLD